MTASAFDPLCSARGVLRAAATGALGTLAEGGSPFSSLVTVATDVDGAPILLISRLAIHTANLDSDPRCSLLLVAPGGEGGDPLAGARLTVGGRARRIAPEDGEVARLRRRFLARQPAAAGYAGFADFGFFRVEVAAAHLVAGFGRIHRVEGGELLVSPEVAEAFAEAEAGVVDHMNADHGDAVRLYATVLLGAEDGDWKVVGADPDGLDLALGASVRRLAFSRRHGAPMGLRAELKALSDRARAEMQAKQMTLTSPHRED